MNLYRIEFEVEGYPKYLKVFYVRAPGLLSAIDTVYRQQPPLLGVKRTEKLAEECGRDCFYAGCKENNEPRGWLL